MPPSTITLDQLDATIRAALKKFPGAKPPTGGILVNGIIVNQADLGALSAKDFLKQLKKDPGFSKLPKPVITDLGNGHFVVGIIKKP